MSGLFLRNQLCIPVKGYHRAIIYDIVRKDYFFIPNEHYHILNRNSLLNFNKIKDYEERNMLVDFLLQEEIIFELADKEHKKRFKAFKTELELANQITSLVVHSNVDLAFFDLIDDEYILNLSIIAPRIDEHLLRVLEKVSTLEIDSVYLYIVEFELDNLEGQRELLSRYSSVFSVNFFGVKDSRIKNELYKNIFFNFFKPAFSEYQNKLTTDKLVINKEHFLEAYNFHSYYHAKVYIDRAGYIKNGLNHPENFGNLNGITKALFFQIISSDAFRELGEINKNDTLVCADCEFRYMCIDSRVPIKGDKGWYHETECAYNPYLAKWENEEGYLTLSESGIDVSGSGCSIDKKKLSAEFKKAWSV